MISARKPAPVASAATAQDRQSSFVATAQVLNFEPGLYEVSITAAQKTLTDLGLVVPCIRLDPVRLGTEASAVFAADQGWLNAGSDPAVLRVAAGRVGLILTIYNLPGLPPPSLSFRRIDQRALQADDVRPDASVAAPSEPTHRLKMIAHIQNAGDISFQEGRWAEGPNGTSLIEGLLIEGQGSISNLDIEYQGIIGRDWHTPWEAGGKFCGSRNLNLPFEGFRVRLVGDAALRFDCAYSGRFVGDIQVGPLLNGDACDAGGASLQSLQLSLLPKQADPKPSKTSGQTKNQVPANARGKKEKRPVK